MDLKEKEKIDPKVMSLDFGNYCLIEQKRFGCENEMFLYKVVGRLRTNYSRPVPVNFQQQKQMDDEEHESIRCICCGVSEIEVETFKLCDVKPNNIFKESSTINFNDDKITEEKQSCIDLIAKAKDLYKPPFKYYESIQGVLDQNGSLVLDVRGWGRIKAMENAEKLQDTLGNIIISALNKEWER